MHVIGSYPYTRNFDGKRISTVKTTLNAIKALEQQTGAKFTRIGLEKIPSKISKKKENSITRFFLALNLMLHRHGVETVQLDNMSLLHFNWLLENLLTRNPIFGRNYYESKSYAIIERNYLNGLQALNPTNEKKLIKIINLFKQQHPTLNHELLEELSDGLYYIRSMQMHEKAQNEKLDLVVSGGEHATLAKLYKNTNSIFPTTTNLKTLERLIERVKAKKQAYLNHQNFFEAIKQIAIE